MAICIFVSKDLMRNVYISEQSEHTGEENAVGEKCASDAYDSEVQHG
jgi:hypothetical protein